MSQEQRSDIQELLLETVRKKGSDLHLAPGLPPMARIHGDLEPLEADTIYPEDLQEMLYDILKPNQIMTLEEELELDFSFSMSGISRFRGNVMRQRNSLGAVFRVVPWEIPKLEELGLPDILSDFCDLPRGLVLLTGPTGSGKSTTLAAMINRINENRRVNIVTVEDPIEFLHQHKSSIIKQREIGTDTHSFPEALRRVLRHDPDVILIGEMRDRESISIALTAAETGHLVFSTLHTQTAALAIHRIIDVFPEPMNIQIRQQVADSLKAVVAQQILPRSDGEGRVVAAEVLVNTPALRNIVREGQDHQIYSMMQTGRREGMQTMDHALARLCLQGIITRQEAANRSVDRKELERALMA